MTIFDEELADTIEAARIRRYGVARYRELRMRERIDEQLLARARRQALLRGQGEAGGHGVNEDTG